MTNFDNKYSEKGIDFNYSRACKTWEFKYAKGEQVNTVLVPANGKEKAFKIASIIAGSLKRCQEIDGLCRANIARLTV